MNKYLQRGTSLEFTLKISCHVHVWFWRSAHAYLRGVGTKEHFGNISWRQRPDVIENVDLNERKNT